MVKLFSLATMSELPVLSQLTQLPSPFAGCSMANCLLPAGQAWYGCELHASMPVRLPSYCSKHLWCEQPVKEIQLTGICYVQICVYSSSYGDFLR